MIVERKPKLKNCRTKLKEKLKSRLNMPVPLRKPLLCADENTDPNSPFFEHFHTNYEVSSQPLSFENRNVRRRLDREFEQLCKPLKTSLGVASQKASTQHSIVGRRNTPRQNLTDRFDVTHTSRGTSRTGSKHKSSGKIQINSSCSRYNKPNLLKL